MNVDSGRKEILTSPETNKEKLRVLVVDDEESIRDLMLRVLKRGNFLESIGLVKVAVDGQEAWDILQENKEKIDVVLTDGRMPRMNGFDLARRVKESGQNITVALISAGMDGFDPNDPIDKNSAMKNFRLAAIFPKPLNLSQFGEFMNQTIIIKAGNSAASQPQTP